MKSDILVSLIKEVVKNEVKNQVKEELAKLVKSGAVTLNSQKKKTTPTLSEMTAPVAKKQPSKPVKQFTGNPMLNEILNQTQPFTAQQRAEGGMPGVTGGSILDAVQPAVSMEGDWETMDFRQTNIPIATEPTPQLDGVSDEYMGALTNALKRDYRELVKRF